MAGAKELVGLNKQRRVTVAGDAGDDAHLERVVEIRVCKRVTIKIRHLALGVTHPTQAQRETERRRGRRPPARSRRRRSRRRRRADPGAAREATQPAVPLSMPGATGCRTPAPLLVRHPVPPSRTPALRTLSTTEEELGAEEAGNSGRSAEVFCVKRLWMSGASGWTWLCYRFKIGAVWPSLSYGRGGTLLARKTYTETTSPGWEGCLGRRLHTWGRSGSLTGLRGAET